MLLTYVLFHNKHLPHDLNESRSAIPQTSTHNSYQEKLNTLSHRTFEIQVTEINYKKNVFMVIYIYKSNKVTANFFLKTQPL